jgi:hypothetical protein
MRPLPCVAVVLTTLAACATSGTPDITDTTPATEPPPGPPNITLPPSSSSSSSSSSGGTADGGGPHDSGTPDAKPDAKPDATTVEAGPPDSGGTKDSGPTIASSLLDVDFGSPTTTKTGAAAAGLGPTDQWNPAGPGFNADYTLSSLVWSNGAAAAGVSMRVQNLPGNWAMTASIGDPMYDSYAYSWAGASATITLDGLPSGTYDWVIYGHTGANDANSGFSITVLAGTTAVWSSASAYTTLGADWNSSIWKTGSQYVLALGVVVGAGQTVVLTIANGATGTGNAGCLINGLQILKQ